MPSEVFPDYDPEEEDIFGNGPTMAPRKVGVTSAQLADPLRKPKVELQSILVAEKIPITAKDIEKRMLEEETMINPAKYGCATLDQLLQKCSDTVSSQRRKDGVIVYLAKVNEANRDIVDSVQAQRDDSKRAPRSFLSSRASTGMGIHGAAFRKGPRMTENVNKIKGTPEQFKMRKQSLPPAKTAGRVKFLADLLRNSRSKIEIQHPIDPSLKVVRLKDLAEEFKSMHDLPPWGKHMSEKDLYQSLNVPQYRGILSFVDHMGDIYVDEGDMQEVPEERPSTPTNAQTQSSRARTMTTSSGKTLGGRSDETENHFHSASSNGMVRQLLDDSSIGGDTKDYSLISHLPHDGFFQSGPGFHDEKKPQENSTSLDDIGRRFGADQPKRQGSRKSSFGTMENSRRNVSFSADSASVLVNDSFRTSNNRSRTSRSINPVNKIQMLADYIRSREAVPFEELPDQDKILVNFNRSVFKVCSTKPDEMLVRLTDPSVDTSTLYASNTNLRSPVEADLLWMAQESFDISSGQHFVKPAMFVPPCGFLMIVHKQSANPDEKLEKMGMELSSAMGTPQELRKEDICPGMIAVYMHRIDQDVQYYRVIIIKQAEEESKVMVMIVDHEDQYFTDVSLDHLYVLPEELSFRNQTPNVGYAKLSGVLGMSETEQRNFMRILDDELRKKFVISYIYSDSAKALTLDMIWRENDQFSWLSQIALRRRAIPLENSETTHLSTDPTEAVQNSGNDLFMDFDATGIQIDSFGNDSIPADIEELVGVESNARISPIQPDTDSAVPLIVNSENSCIDPQNVNMYEMFQKAMASKNMSFVVCLSQVAKTMANFPEATENWKFLVQHMEKVAIENNLTI